MHAYVCSRDFAFRVTWLWHMYKVSLSETDATIIIKNSSKYIALLEFIFNMREKYLHITFSIIFCYIYFTVFYNVSL